MAKRLLAAMAGIAFLMTLAYYSGSLRSERAMEQEKERLLAQIESLELLTKEQAAAPGDRVQADTAASGGRKTQVKMEETGSEEPAKFRFFIKEADGLVNIYREEEPPCMRQQISRFPCCRSPCDRKSAPGRAWPRSRSFMISWRITPVKLAIPAIMV